MHAYIIVLLFLTNVGVDDMLTTLIGITGFIKLSTRLR